MHSGVYYISGKDECSHVFIPHPIRSWNIKNARSIDTGEIQYVEVKIYSFYF